MYASIDLVFLIFGVSTRQWGEPCDYCPVGIHNSVLWFRLLTSGTRVMDEAVKIPRYSEENRAETPYLLARYPGPVNTSRAPGAAIGEARPHTENPDWAH